MEQFIYILGGPSQVAIISQEDKSRVPNGCHPQTNKIGDNKIGDQKIVTYSGLTYVAIGSAQHFYCTAALHALNFTGLLYFKSFKDINY